MKKTFILIFLAVFIFQTVNAQNCSGQRYTAPIFSDVTVSEDIVYGKADSYDALNIYFLQDIRLDFYEPTDDTLMQRPLVIMMFGGAFLGGDKGFYDMVAWGDSLARYGYAVASIDYRLGFNTFSNESAIRAVYRAVQDCRAAVRYMKEFHEVYRIDTTKIFLGGNSAGSITAIHTAFLTEDEDRPEATFGIDSPFSNEDDDLGCPDCSGNDYQHSVEISGIINLWGAINDTLNIDPDENVPMLHIHGVEDGTVPFDFGPPFGGLLPVDPLYGSKPIHERLENLGIYDEFEPYIGLDHAFYLGGLSMNEYWPEIWDLGKNFLHTLQNFETPEIEGENIVCIGEEMTYSVDFNNGSKYCWEVENGTILNENNNEVTILWDTETTGNITTIETNYNDLAGMSSFLEIEVSAFPTADFSYTINNQEVSFTNLSEGAVLWSWDFGNNTFSDEENPTQTFEVGTYEITLTATNSAGCETVFIETIMVEPNGVYNIFEENSNINLYPNPVENILNIDFLANENAEVYIEIYSIDGKLVQSNKEIVFAGENQFSVNVKEFVSALYLMKIEMNGDTFYGKFSKK